MLTYHHHVQRRCNDSVVEEKKRRADMCQAGCGRGQKSELSSELQLLLPLIHLPRCAISTIFQLHSFLHPMLSLLCFRYSRCLSTLTAAQFFPFNYQVGVKEPGPMFWGLSPLFVQGGSFPGAHSPLYTWDTWESLQV